MELVQASGCKMEVFGGTTLGNWLQDGRVVMELVQATGCKMAEL